MSDEIIVSHCSPTLAGIKTANIFSAEYESKKSVMAELKNLNSVLSPKGLEAVALSFGKKRALIYIYRPARLARDLSDKNAVRILSANGYKSSAPDECISRLIEKFNEKEEFPHEIGLFLGYPPDDVSGFIENNACNYKLKGLWKVYGDEEKAKILFERYKKCTRLYCEQLKKGKTIKQLTVAV